MSFIHVKVLMIKGALRSLCGAAGGLVEHLERKSQYQTKHNILCFLCSGMSRALRSYPVMPSPEEIISSPKEAVEEDDLLAATVENSQILLTGGQNHTPDYQQVKQSDSESSINNNSSSDFPAVPQSDLQPAGALSEKHRDPAAPPVVYDGQSKAKENWIGQKPTSVIIQQHRSDEM